MVLRATQWARSPRTVLVPLAGLALAVVACTSIAVVYRRQTANDRAQLALAGIRYQLTDIQSLQWQVRRRQVASRPRIRLRLASRERAIRAELDGLLSSDPPPSLQVVERSLQANFEALAPIVAPASPSRTGTSGALAAAQMRSFHRALGGLDAAAAVYARRAVVAQWSSRIAFGAGVLGLLGGFLFYFLRSERIRARLSVEATTDTLTGLANRATFSREVAVRLRRSGSGVVLFIDLDEFKDINDVFGHRGGDAVLREVAVRLTRHTRAGDVCARLGGDEFAVFLEDADREAGLAFADRIGATLAEPIVVGGGVARVGASIGLAAASPGVELETLVHWADVAMYAAKAEDNGGVEVFDPRLLAGESSRVAFERQLGQAADAGELVVHYQPVVSLADGQCQGAEALVRWNHPERGLLPPAEFIAAAERTGAIVDIGAFVLRRACADAAAWAGASKRPLAAYVNVSGRQLADRHFVDAVSEALADAGLPPERLVLELTESALLHASGIGERLAELVARGARIAIDDFGTGYASLTTLRSLPLDTVKIDRSFVARAGEGAADEAVVAAIVQMAARLGLRTVAEGVERSDQERLLAGLGAEAVQGFLHLRPIEAERFLAWLEQEPAARLRPVVAPAAPLSA